MKGEITNPPEYKHSTTPYYKRARKITWIAFGIAVCLIILFAWKHYKIDWNETIDIPAFDAFGSIVGGIIGSLLSFASFLLVLDTINRQEKAWQIDKLDSRFFELLRFHRENIANISIGNELKGYDALKKIKELYLFIYKKLLTRLEVCEGELGEHYKQLKDVFLYDITSKILGLGCNEDNGKIVIKILTDELEKYKIDNTLVTTFQNELYDIARFHISNDDKDKDYFNENKEILQLNKNDLIRDYFAFLQRIVIYINEKDSSIINYEQKLEYIRLLKTIMVTDEQILLFLNSLTQKGEEWEFKFRKRINDKVLGDINLNKCLITKYDLIRNIPLKDLEIEYKIDAKKFFPDVHYYEDNMNPQTEQKLKWKKKYV